MNYTLAFKSLVSLALFALLVPGVSFAEIPSTITAVTHPASDITETTARLNGYGAKQYNQITVWFEWGETPSLGSQTYSRVFWGEYTYKNGLIELKRGTRYYYRAVVVSGGETRYGETLSFTTKGATPTSGSTGSSNTASAVGSSTGTGSTSRDAAKSTTSSTATKSSSTASSKTTTTKTAASTSSANDDCATTTAATLTGGTLAANAGGSDTGIGGLTIFLILVVIALAIAAAVMRINAAREAERRKQAAQGMVLA